VHQAKYTKDIVRKFKMEDSKAMVTPMSTTTALDADEEGEHVDQKEYQSMIGSLFYLTMTRPDIQFSVCLCARFQASPRTSHRQAVKRIFRYLHHTPNFGLWYSASSSLALHGFSDADFAGCRLLTPKFGIGRSLICGPNSVKNPSGRRKVSSERFGKGARGRQFASVRQRDCSR
jgi:hypothetical protein